MLQKPWPPILTTVARAAVVMALVVALAITGFVAVRLGRPQMVLFGAGALVAVALWLHLGRLEYGIATIVLTSGFVRFQLSTGTQSAVVASLMASCGAVGLWLLQMLTGARAAKLKPVSTNAPLLAFAAICVASYVWSNMFRDVMVRLWGSFPLVQLAALAVMVLLPAVFLMTSNVVEDVRWLRTLTWLIIVIGALSVPVYELVFQFRVLPSSHPLNWLFQTHGLFAMWVAALAYAMALYDETLPKWLRGFLLLLVAAWVHWRLVIGESWVSGWAPMGVACTIVTFLRSRKLFAILSVLALLYMFTFTTFAQRVFDTAETTGSYERLHIWAINFEHILQHPVLGSGPAGYAVYYMTYHPRYAYSSHNNLFDIAAQTGMAGLVCFTWFFAALGVLGFRLCRRLGRSRNFEAAFAAATFAGCVAAFASMMLGDWVIPFAYNQTITGFDHSVYTWILLGGMVSLHHMLRARDEATGTIAPG